MAARRPLDAASTILARAPAKVDRLRRRLRRAGSRDRLRVRRRDAGPAQESDEALVDSVKTGRQRHPARRCDVRGRGRSRRGRTMPDTGFRLDAPGIVERKLDLSAVPGARRRGRRRSATTCSCSTPTARCATRCRSCESGDRVLPSLGLAAALARRRHRPGAVRLDRRRRSARSAIARCRWRRGGRASADGDRRLSVGAHRLPRAGVSRRSDSAGRIRATRSSICCSAEKQILNGQKPNVDPAVFKDKIVFVGVDGHRPVRRVRDAVCAAARCRACRSTPRWPTTSCRTGFIAPAGAARARRDGGRRRAGRRPRRDARCRRGGRRAAASRSSALFALDRDARCSPAGTG